MIDTPALPPEAATKIDAALVRAMELQLSGRLDLAEQLYGAILQASPANDAANYCMGMLHVQTQRSSESLPYLLAALESKPELSEYWLGVVEALIAAGQFADAQATLELGRQHGLDGAAMEAVAARLAARQAGLQTAGARTVGSQPEGSQAKGSPPPAGRAPPAEPAPPPVVPVAAAVSAALASAVRPAAPAVELRAADRPTAAQRSARRERRDGEHVARKRERELLAMIEKRDFEPAVKLARSLTERFPERGIGWKVLGAFLPTDDGYDACLAALETAVRLMPFDPEAHVNLGLTLAKAKRLERAEFHIKRALELKPDYAAAHYRLAVAYEMQGRYADAEASLLRGVAVRSGDHGGDDELSYSHLLFLMSHSAVDPEALFAAHRRFGEYFEGRLRSSWPVHENDADPDRTIKVGLVSGDLCNHAVATFVEPILVQMSPRAGLELHAYYTHSKHDETSQRLLGHFKTWNIVNALSDEQLAGVILKDRIDILIDLSGHTGLNRLPMFARKPAPVQASWIGYPGTTGLLAMDYFLGDPHFLPPGQFDRYFTEKLVYLPAQTPFKPQEGAPPVNDLPALDKGYVTLGSFNRLGKMNGSTIDLWAQVLRALPGSRMLVGGLGPNGPCDWLIDQFAANGIERDRLMLHDRCGVLTYLQMYHQVDLCLDTFPYNGGTTNIHGIWMGVPTLTVAGPTPAARQGAAILSQVGLQGFTAANPAEFVERGIYWATHLPELAQIRLGLRERLRASRSRRADVIAAALEYALRRMWRRWCAKLPPESFSCDAADPVN